jgi:exonuclease III
MQKPGEFSGYFHCAAKKATAAWNLHPKAPDAVIEGIGDAEFDAEGRYLQADFGDLSVFPSTCRQAPAPRSARPPNSASWTSSCPAWPHCAPAART